MALLTTHSGFRAAHMEYAVEKGVNVFMEKCFAADPGGMQRILRAGEAAEKKNLKIATGLMCRHSSARHAMIHHIRDGAMGQIELIRTYRMDSGHRQGPYDKSQNELLWQIRRPDLVFWYGTGVFVDWTIHQIDECCWIKDAWPVSAHGVGGRVANSPDCGQNLDSYSVEYTFPDGTKAMATGALYPELLQRFRHLPSRGEMRRTVLGKHPCADRVHVQGPTHFTGKHRMEAGEGKDQSLSGRVERALDAIRKTGRTTRRTRRPIPTSRRSWDKPPSTWAESSPGRK